MNLSKENIQLGLSIAGLIGGAAMLISNIILANNEAKLRQQMAADAQKNKEKNLEALREIIREFSTKEAESALKEELAEKAVNTALGDTDEESEQQTEKPDTPKILSDAELDAASRCITNAELAELISKYQKISGLERLSKKELLAIVRATQYTNPELRTAVRELINSRLNV